MCTDGLKKRKEDSVVDLREEGLIFRYSRKPAQDVGPESEGDEVVYSTLDSVPLLLHQRRMAYLSLSIRMSLLSPGTTCGKS